MKLSIQLKQQLEELKNKAAELINKSDASLDDIKNVNKEIETLQAKIKTQEAIEDEEEQLMQDKIKNKNIKPVGGTKNKSETAFFNAIKAGGGCASLNEEDIEILNATTATEGVPEDGGLTVPEDVRTRIMELRRSYPDALENYVHVEPVTTLSGSRVIETNADYVPFDNIEEAAEFPEMEVPKFTQFDYKVKKKGGILKITRELLQDTAENIKGYLVRWVGLKSKVTRNALILKMLNEKFGTTKVAVKNLDDLKNIFNVKLDPAIALSSIVITNQDGFNYLDKLKNEKGEYILQPDPTQKTKQLLFGQYPVVRVSNKTMPSAKSKAPVYCGDLKEAITIFDRETLSLDFNDRSDATWNKDLIAMKARERLDIKEVDTEAIVVGEIDLTTTPVDVGA